MKETNDMLQIIHNNRKKVYEERLQEIRNKRKNKKTKIVLTLIIVVIVGILYLELK